MGLSAGARLGVYEIGSPLGAGGMGEVYRARDPRLKRDIALKVLPETTAADPDRRARFEREAQSIAALSHPNIVTIYSVEEVHGVLFLTMEYVEGKPLSDLVVKGGLPLTQILNLAIPLADAVSAAHQRGITHRDLKPANVMVTADGRVKVLDFGLAKLMEASPVEMGVTGLPTSPLTGEGRIVGTVAYMSPEQAEGKPVDHRSDIFSLGIMLYEMATGERPFKGDTSVSVISSIIKDTPASVTDLRPHVPRELSRIVKRCLVKDADRRYQTAKDLRNELEELKHDVDSGELVPPDTPRVAPTRWWPRAAVTAGVLTALALILAWRWTSAWPMARSPVAVEATFTQLTSEPGMEVFPSLSPDGQWVVYSSDASGHAAIYLKSVGGQQAFNLTKDSPADDTQPAFSPDGQRIAFRSEREGGGIFVMGRTGESVHRVTESGFNPAWSPNGEEIAFADEGPFTATSRNQVSGLWAVTVATGAKRLVTKGDAVQPSWSPHGQRIAYWAVNGLGDSGGTGAVRDLWTVPANGGPALRVTDDPAVDWNPIWAPDGKFLYFASDRGGSMNLWRVPIDEASGRVLGRPEAITTPAAFVGHLSIAADGRHVAYASILRTVNLQTLAFEPSTQTVRGTPVPLTSGSRQYANPDVSPDGASVAFTSVNPQEDIFVSREDGTGLRQLTNDLAVDRLPKWSPDGQRIAFQSNRNGRFNIWSIHSDGSGLEPITDANLIWPVWSPDGSRMVATDINTGTYLFDPRIPWNQQTPQTLPPHPSGRTFIATSWSPDGTRLAGVLVPLNKGGIVIYHLASGAYQPLTGISGSPFEPPTGANPQWLNDNDHLLFSWQSKLFLVDQATHVRELLSVAPDRIVFPALSRDNRRIVFSRFVSEADIWLATLK
jgi:serine/threonine protein kinase/dipeptidyl aminopeptidase/acylaminoacyl peptidase